MSESEEALNRLLLAVHDVVCCYESADWPTKQQDRMGKLTAALDLFISDGHGDNFLEYLFLQRGSG
jgi:hypothetical protein